MNKKVVLVGHCGADSAYLRIAVNGIVKDAAVVSVDEETTLNDAIAKGADLLLVNRQIDYGFPTYEGIELIRSLKLSNPALKMMLVSNFEEAQEAAVQAGALPGFGKREIGTDKVRDRLRTALLED